MLSWLFVIVLSLVLAYIVDHKPPILNEKAFIIIQSLVLGWFVSFGGRAMTDQHSYMQLFNSIANTPLGDVFALIVDHINSITSPKNSFELGYVFLNVLFSKIGFGYVGFLFIFSVVMNYLLLRYVLRGNTILLSIIILLASTFYLQQANLVRQMMSVVIFAYATKFIISKEVGKYFLFIFLASTIHMSSLILLPLYFIVDRHFSKYLIIIVWMISVSINRLGLELKLLNTFNLIYYNTPIERIYRPEELIFSFMVNLLFIISALLSQKKMFKEPFIQVSFNLYFIGVVLLNLSTLGFLFYRSSLYFSIFSFVIIPLIPHLYRDNSFIEKIKLGKYGSFITLGLFLYFINILIRRVISTDVVTLGTEFYSFTDFLK
jgi:transmembrane protein EpsG